MSNEINKNLLKLTSLDTCACIAMDVVGSEEFKDKEEVRVKLKKIANALNKRYKSVLVVPFQVRKGDEIVGVVSSFSKGYKVYRDVRRYAWKLKLQLYFGLGLGNLDTGSVTDVNEINGSAVINAFRALDNHLKDKTFLKTYAYQKYEQHVSFYALGIKGVPFRAINALVYTIYNELNGNTEKQRELVKRADMDTNLTFEELGGQIGYTMNARENVSKLFSRLGYEKYNEMQDDLIDLLDTVQQNLK